MQTDGQQSIFAGIIGHLPHGNLVHPFLIFARPDQLADFYRRVPEIIQGQIVEVVVSLPGVQQIACHHRVECRACKIYARPAQDDNIVFQILPDFLDGWVFQHRPK